MVGKDGHRLEESISGLAEAEVAFLPLPKEHAVQLRAQQRAE